MQNEEFPRDTAGEPAGDGQDRVVEVMRSIPRMRAVEELDDKVRQFAPPPPFSSRIGGMAQGCGGVLLTLTAIVMVMAALWFGYHLWGPGLLLAGGLLLVGGTLGVWRGRQVPLVVSVVVIVALAVVAYFWYSFVPAAGALAPLGGLGMMIGMIVLLVILVLIATLISDVITLIYWRRLSPSTMRSAIVWALVAGVLVVGALVFHFTQQAQRMAWLDEHLEDWTAQAATDSLRMGSAANVTLGYSFVTMDEDDDDRLDVRLAELSAAAEAGASVVRLTASGDMLLEAEQPRLFKADEDKDPAEEQAKIVARIARQRDDETAYLDAISQLGVGVIVSDAQYTPYLLMKANDEEKITWEEFTQVQEDRERHYARALQPLAYEVVSEPGQYAQYSGIAEQENADEIGQWVAQTERLAAAVREESPETLVGVTIAISDDFDLDFYERVLALESIDFIGVRIFQPAAFDVLEEVLAERGHPADHGKELWLLETWYGYCLAPQRSMDLDATWLETVAAFAAKERITTVLANDYGCFLQAGGTLFQGEVDLQGRTEVWRRWQELIRTWEPAS
ncbi:MAG: hypothetical protein M5U29_15895 [Anaerolineae bacterium]|nr:hypothetical protein [Anaerolineae bacterium]